MQFAAYCVAMIVRNCGIALADGATEGFSVDCKLDEISGTMQAWMQVRAPLGAERRGRGCVRQQPFELAPPIHPSRRSHNGPCPRSRVRSLPATYRAYCAQVGRMIGMILGAAVAGELCKTNYSDALIFLGVSILVFIPVRVVQRRPRSRVFCCKSVAPPWCHCSGRARGQDEFDPRPYHRIDIPAPYPPHLPRVCVAPAGQLHRERGDGPAAVRPAPQVGRAVYAVPVLQGRAYQPAGRVLGEGGCGNGCRFPCHPKSQPTQLTCLLRPLLAPPSRYRAPQVVDRNLQFIKQADEAAEAAQAAALKVKLALKDASAGAGFKPAPEIVHAGSQTALVSAAESGASPTGSNGGESPDSAADAAALALLHEHDKKLVDGDSEFAILVALVKKTPVWCFILFVFVTNLGECRGEEWGGGGARGGGRLDGTARCVAKRGARSHKYTASPIPSLFLSLRPPASTGTYIASFPIVLYLTQNHGFTVRVRHSHDVRKLVTGPLFAPSRAFLHALLRPAPTPRYCPLRRWTRSAT
jgi:hypothetical protein